MAPRSRAVVLAIAMVACTGGGAERSTSPTETTAETAPPSPGTSGTGTPPTPGPTPQSDVRLPADTSPTAETTRDIGVLAASRFEALVPPEAEVVSTSLLVQPQDPLDQVAIVWRRGVDPTASEIGFIVWQPFSEPPTWRALYAVTDPAEQGVLGITAEAGDLTGDGTPDLLSFEDRGGTGGCGTYRVIRSLPGDAEEVFRRNVCDTEIGMAGGDLEIVSAVYEADDAHCCPSAFRTTTLRWDGEGWERVASLLEPTQPS